MAAAEVIDLANVGAALSAALRLPVDFSPLLRKVAVLLRADILRCFDEGRSPDGTPWKPLKASTVRRRRQGRGKGSAKPLRDTGIMMLSATAQGARGHVERVSATALVYGSNLDRAGWQNDGTRTIPARPFVGISPRAMKVIENMVADFAAAKLAGK